MNNWALPFFGGKATQPMKTETFQNKLETFTGTSRFDYHKKEIKPLFVPNKNVSFVNGSPIYDEGVRDRFVDSNYRNTELPFEQQKVSKRCRDKITEIKVGGFHQYDIQDIARPKTVDELRVLSNPKTTYKQPVLVVKVSQVEVQMLMLRNIDQINFILKVHQDILELLAHFLKIRVPRDLSLKIWTLNIKRNCWWSCTRVK